MWTLHEGDCLEVMPTLPSRSIDMILCDLPYGTTACAWDSVIPFEPLWAQYKRIIKPNGAIVLCAGQPFTSVLAVSNLQMFRYEWIWEKDQGRNFQNAKRQPLKITESILVFYKEFPTYNPQGLEKLHKPIKKSNRNKIGRILPQSFAGETYMQEYANYPKNLLRFNSDRGYHPTQKPVALFDYLIRTYTNPGDTVLDNCAGSGTTGVAAEQCGRNSILIERDPQYCEVIRNRISQVQQPLFIA